VPSDAIAADASLDTEQPDTAEPADSTVADTAAPGTFDAAEVAPDADAAEADAGPPPFCDTSNANLIGCYRFRDSEHATQPWDDSMYSHHGTSSGDGLTLGMNSPSGDQFDGALDSIRIYRVARAATQICRAAGTC